MTPEDINTTEKRRVLVQSWLSGHGGSIEDYLFFGIASRFSYGFLVFDRTDGSSPGLIELRDQ